MGKNNRHAQQDTVTNNRLENYFCFSIVGPYSQYNPQLENSHNVNKQVFAHDTNHIHVLAASGTSALVSFFREIKILV